MARTGGVIGMSLRRWIMPASPGSQAWTGVGGTQTQAVRGYAQERPQDSSASNWGSGEPPIDEKATQRGVAPGTHEEDHLHERRKRNTDSEGQVQTPNLTRQKSTRDFIHDKREERMNAAQDSMPTSHVDPEGAEHGEKIKKEGASPADLASA